MIDPSHHQLQEEVDASIRRALKTGRPILTHINADTTWLIQLPYPERRLGGRVFSNVLIDPWLRGPQSDVASWFSTQYHAIQSSIQTIEELEERLRDSERLGSTSSFQSPANSYETRASYIDAVVISHEFTDHCHQATLLEIHPSVPVFASNKAAELIRSWNHFEQVETIPAFSAQDSDWRHTSIEPLLSWIGISRVVTKGNALYYHSALLVTFSSRAGDSAEAIIYSPHGIVADDLAPLKVANPRIQILALLHGLHDVGIRMTAQLNLGAHNGLRAQRLCKARYWIGTHDEIKKPGGLLAPFLRRTVWSLRDALEKEKAETGVAPDVGTLAELENVNFVNLGSGESLLLQ